MRYKKHKVSFNDEGNGTRLSKSFGMYDLATAVTILGDSSDDTSECKPKISCTSRSRWLVVAAGCDINVFDLAVGIEHKWTISFHDEDSVICVKFLPDDDLFLAVLSSGIVALCMPLNTLMKEDKILPPLKDCSVAVVNEPEKYSICVLETSGSAHFLSLEKLSSNIKREIDSLNSVKLLYSSEEINCHFVVWTLNCFAYFPELKGNNVKVSPIHCNGSTQIFSDWFKLCEDICVIRNVGRFIVALTAKNQMIFYDLNLTKFHTLDLSFVDSSNSRPGWSSFDHNVLDFEFLDVVDFTEFNPDVRILFKLKMGSNYKFVLRSLGDESALFDSNCSNETTLIPHATPGDDSNIVFVEAFLSNAPNNILIRFVSEALPTLRLKRLLDLGRFNDALEFAKLHDLSLDIVYTACIRNCQDMILSESGYEESVFEEMMKYLALLSDHDEACDFCIAALMAVDKYNHIERILEFTQSKKISDEGTLLEIDNFRYELASYRMLFGANQARYDRDSQWPVFLTADNHIGLLDQFYKQDCIVEARILFSRYPIEASSYFTTLSAIERLLGMLTKCITENPATHVEISEFLEFDLLKYFLFNQNLSEVVPKCEKLLDFIIDITKRLERIQSKGFPENSLFFALSFQRGLSNLKQNCLTSDQQIESVLVLDMLDVDSFSQDKATGRLNIMLRNLKRLVRIHRVYQCPMSYSEFMNRDVQTICYGILDRVRTAQSVREHIERFVFPYMVEHNLDKNEMLHKYIKQLASNLYRGSSQYSNSWDQLCLQIAENIVDADLRCKAVIEISAASVPPWSEQLMNVVKNTLTDTENVDPSLIEQLRVECRRAELGQIFVIYHIPLSFRSITMDVVSLKALLQFIFKNSDKDPSVKLADAFKILNIYESLMDYSMVSRIECYRLYAISIIMQLTSENQFDDLINFFQLIKSPEERDEVAIKLVQHLKCLLIETRLKKVREQRLIWIASLLCVVERFAPKSAEMDTVFTQTRNIRRLQTQYDLIVGFATLSNKEKCAQHLCNYVNESSTKKSLFEVVSFGQLFSMSIREIFRTIVDIELDNTLAEVTMSTLEFYVEREMSPDLSDLDVCLRVCTSTLWNITNAAVDSGTEFHPLVRIVKLFRSTLPRLLDWSTKLQSINHVDAFCKINGYIILLSHILERCPLEDNGESFERDEVKTPDEFDVFKGADIMYTNRRRIGAFLPFNEGSFFDHSNVIRNASIVASSVVNPPLEKYVIFCLPINRNYSVNLYNENDFSKFHIEMREYWQRLYDSLSSHNLLEIYARQFSYSLPCFHCVSDEGPIIGMQQCISELCQKILNVSTADLLLAAHLLLRISLPNMKQCRKRPILRPSDCIYSVPLHLRWASVGTRKARGSELGSGRA